MSSIVSSLTLAHLTIGATPLETVEAAAHAGFGAAGVRICGRRPGDDFRASLLNAPERVRELKSRASDRGVRLSNVSGYQFYPDVTLSQVEPVIAATAAIGAPIVVANGFDPVEARFIELFARYCGLARQGGLRVALEFLPYSGVRNLESAMRVIDASGADNAGVLLDALHLERSGGTPGHIRSVPQNRIVFAQLCDAPAWKGAKTDDALLREARGARLPAGAGTLPLYEFLDALPAGCEIEYEVARGDMATRNPIDKALAAAEDATRFMKAYEDYRSAATSNRDS
jgi:sugar phosphate isomerase/epimerase